MKVYLVVNNCPCEFDTPKTISVHLTLKGARLQVNKLKMEHPYEYQYVEVQSKKVEP